MPALACWLAACAATPVPAVCRFPARQGNVAWVVDHGWHTEIGLPADEMSGELAVFRTIFPGARTLMFGFGKRTFITARVETFSELLLGPVPGPGAIQVTGLPGPPDLAYDLPITRLDLPSGGAQGLSAFLWDALGKTASGAPRLIARGLFAGSLFYASARGYSLEYDCNAWTAAALHAAGLPVDPAGVVFAGGVLRQTARIGAACRPAAS